MTAEANQKPSMKERQWEFREQQILETARKLLSKKGFAAMTLEDVITEVGISKPTFYQHFTSKEKLAVTVLIREIKDTCQRLKEYEAELAPDEALKAMINWAIDRHFGVCTYYDLTNMVPLCAHKSIKAAECELTKLLADLIAKTQKAGSVKNTTPPLLLAQFLNSILKDNTYQDEIKNKRLTLPEMKAEIVKLLLG